MMKYFVRAAVSVLVMACCAFSMHALDKSFYAESSKLATGKWVKIAVTASGIYQITATERIINRIEISSNYKKYGTVAAGVTVEHLGILRQAVDAVSRLGT